MVRSIPAVGLVAFGLLSSATTPYLEFAELTAAGGSRAIALRQAQGERGSNAFAAEATC